MEPLVLRPAATALVIIDLQKGIVAVPTEPHPASDVVKNAALLADAMRDLGGLVVLVHVVPGPDGKDLLTPTLDPGAPTFPPGRPPGWSDLVPELAGHPQDHVVPKKQWGAFYGTDLDLQLRRRRIDTIVLCGISTNLGVESTARAAFEHGYQQIFVEDAMAARSRVEHDHTVAHLFPRIGRVRSTDEVIAALRAG
jgi:nicotinamidase-related amidase